MISSLLNIVNQRKQGKVAYENKKQDSQSYSLYKVLVPRSFDLHQK